MRHGTVSLIVVGVDGSEHSLAAIRWAAAEARLRGARLRLVTAWKVSTLMYAAEAFPPPYTVDIEARSGARPRDARPGLPGVAADLEGLEVERAAAQRARSERPLRGVRIADMLVVGSRGHGGFSGLLLGSVSHQCAQQAPCPVMIVRGPAS